MADKIIGLRINVVGTDDIVKRIGNLNAELEQTKLETNQLAKALKTAVSAGNAADVAKYSQELAQARAKQNDLKTESANLNKELRLQQKAFKAAASEGQDSYAALDAQLSVLRNRFKQLSAAEREGDVGRQLTQQIDSLNTELVDADAKLGVFTRNVGNYSDSVVKALRRAANEDALLKDIDKLQLETENLQAKSKALYATLEKGDKGVDTANTVKELAQIEQQLKINQSALTDLNKQFGDKKTLSTPQGGRGVGARDVRNLGKLGGGALSGVAGDFLQGSDAAAKFGVAGVAAFGIFAAGGLAFKAISALDELNKKFQKLEGDAGRASGASGLALKGIVVDVEAVSKTFGKDANDVLKTTQALSQNLGVDFATALSKVEQGLLTSAGGAEGFLDALSGSAEAARIAGLSIDELIGFSNEATKSGILSERGLELVSEFGKNIKTNSSEAKAALTDALGSEFTDKLFTNVQNGSITSSQAIQQVSTKLNEAGISGDKAGKVLSDAFGTATAAENEFILGLNKTIGGVNSYIDSTNSLTRTQQAQLKANKELASAQQGLAQAFDGTGISLEAFGTKIKTTLANVATKAVLAFNKVFGDGLAAGREELRKTTEALNSQNENIRNLEQNITPLLTRYDELNAVLPTLVEGSDEATAAQAELANIIQIVGGTIPQAITGFGKYNEALGINADAARKFIDQQVALGKTLEQAQADVAIEQYRKLRAESDKLTKSFDGQGNSLRDLSGSELFVQGLGNPFGEVETTAKRTAEETLAAGQQLAQYGKELQELDKVLKQTEAGRRELANSLAIQSIDVFSFSPDELIKRQNALFEQLNKEAADAAAKGANDKLAADKKATDAQIAAQRKANDEKAKEAAKAAAEKAKAERDRLLDEEKATREALEGAQKETADAITELSLQGIEDRAKREEESIKLSTAQRIESETKALQDAAVARVKTLQDIAKSNDPQIRKQFGTPEQVAAQIDAVNNEVQNAITAQTGLILRERDKQIAELQKSRLEAINEAVQSIDANALQGAISEVQSRLAIADNEGSRIQLSFEVSQDAIDDAEKEATTKLGVLRAANVISEREYQQQLNIVAADAAKQRIDLLINNYDQQSSVISEKAALQKLQIEGDLLAQTQGIQDARTEQVKTLDAQLENQLISQQTYDEAIVALNETTNAQIALANQIAAQETLAVDETTGKERIDLEREITDAQLEYLAERAAAYRENQQAILQEFADAVSEAGTFVLAAAKTADDFFTASENNKKAEIEARYATELNGARGNAEQIAQIERRKEAELAKIERAAAARRKAIAIAQAVVNGAVAVTNILATTPDPTGIFTAIRIAGAIATTAAQVALISSQQFEQGGSIPAADGFISGRSHSQGGVHGTINGQSVEVEGGEYKATDEFGNAIIVNKQSSRIFKNALKSISGKTFAGKRQALSDINSYRGLGVRFAAGGSVPPQSVGNGLTVSAQSAQSQAGAMMQLINETRNLALEVSQQVNRFVVVADAQEIVKQGMKDTPRKNTQIL
jgi:hypothetical protein